MGNRYGAHYARYDLRFHVYPHPRRTLCRSRWSVDCCWISKPSRTRSIRHLVHLCVSSTSYRLLFIIFIDGLLSLSLLMLILVVPHQSSPQKQRLQIVLWTGITMVMYSVLVALFRIKNRGLLPLSSLISFRLLISHHDRISLQTLFIMLSSKSIVLNILEFMGPHSQDAQSPTN